MKIQLKLALSSAAIAALAACGGDGGGSTSPVASTTTDVSVTVLDGPIKDALVCQDINNDGACASSEPHATTNGSGVAVVTVATADKDKYPMLAIVTTAASDRDTGLVPTGFVLKTPAGKPALMSPLTTLVQNLVAQTGQTVEAAEAQLKLQTGITSSLFSSFAIADVAPADGSVKPATLARMLVLTAQQQAQLVASANAVGTTAADGSTVITQALLDAVVQKRVQELLSAIVAALPSTATEANMQTAAAALVASQGIQPAGVTTAVAIYAQPAATGTPGVAGASLNSLVFTSATDWSTNANAWTAAQNTPAADGSTRWHQVHTALKGGSAPYSWGYGTRPGRGSELHWSGTAWTGCPINFENTSFATNANGHSPYNYCDGKELGEDYKTTSLSLEGQTMVSVLDQVKALGYTNFNVANAASVLGTATFPPDPR